MRWKEYYLMLQLTYIGYMIWMILTKLSQTYNPSCSLVCLTPRPSTGWMIQLLLSTFAIRVGRGKGKHC